MKFELWNPIARFIYTHPYMKPYYVECFGTFVLTLVAMLAGGNAASVVLIALVYAGGPVSGANYNPAVSTALWFLKKMPASTYGKYVLAQLIGAMFGIFIARVLDAKLTIAPFAPASFGAMFVAETIFTALLVLTVLSVAVSKRAVGNQYFGLAIGLALLTGQMAVAGISGAVFNPAIVLAQPITDFSHAVSYLIPSGVYVTAQLTGAILAALLYAKTTEEN